MRLINTTTLLVAFTMATTLHLCGVKTPYLCCSKRASCVQPVRRQQSLHSAVSLPSVAAQCLPFNGLCRTVGQRFRCAVGEVDLLERNDTQNFDSEHAEEELTCVMKFGGSSVASAERMREVADLILSFPEERPVIVLSAMGKTTNKLLMVHFWLCFCISFIKFVSVF